MLKFAGKINQMKAVILAGGGGTRLWPLSTPEKPKQFHSLVSDKTLLQDTFERLSFLEPRDIFVATNASYANYIESQLPEISKENIIIEPALRDTASCIGFAATIINNRFGKDEVMAIIYSDHLIKNKRQFEESLRIAEQIAKSESTLNIVEVPALTPNTGLGYVHLGDKWNTIDDTDIFEIKNFTEKPDLETAKHFVESGQYAWNTGIYIWKASTLLEKFAIHAPDSYEKLMKIDSALTAFTSTSKNSNPFTDPTVSSVITETYPTLQKISIDFAIMEKVDPKEIRIILSNLGWSDIGTWDTLFAELRETGREEKIKELEIYKKTYEEKKQQSQ